MNKVIPDTKIIHYERNGEGKLKIVKEEYKMSEKGQIEELKRQVRINERIIDNLHNRLLQRDEEEECIAELYKVSRE